MPSLFEATRRPEGFSLKGVYFSPKAFTKAHELRKNGYDVIVKTTSVFSIPIHVIWARRRDGK